MKTISFVGNSEPPHKLLEIFSRFTPGKSGEWGNLKGCPHYGTDYYAVIDKLPNEVRGQVDETKCVFLGAHAKESHYAYCDMSSYRGIKMYDCSITNFGFGEWWIKYDYDYLTKLQPMTKSKSLACISSNAQSQAYHNVRRDYLDRFCNKYADKLNLYGRIQPWGNLGKCYKGVCGSSNPGAKDNDHMSGKEPVYEEHKYAMEFDAVGKYYFSERLFDCMLLWCYPIYWGGLNLHTFIPKESFSYVNINGHGDDVIDIINSNVYERALPAMKEARELLLNKYQIWPWVHNAIFGTFK